MHPSCMSECGQQAEEGINKVSWKLELVKPTAYILVRAYTESRENICVCFYFCFVFLIRNFIIQ